MHTFLVVIQVLVAVALIGLVLIQHGKGADAGAAFGSGASGTVFGSRGAANFLSRVTAGLAFVFFVSSLALAYWVGGRGTAPASVVDTVPAQAEPAQVSIPDEAPVAAPAGDSAQPEGPKVPE
ncbi:preprotein translocase subunit SecG [Hydrocarboniphaga daqingensis]|jgi:preprotein translocase subunit SecG|uniref:Protein-export membrane protein SecG n=1 Tax=Hydrocarboniphaga daqingensis TaxID=490188 RepID=A0A1M5PZ23_9GAMM|nr:preprotein translocase subunit SecG [Hydrocarboniphaga daqingensis]SHH07018.1 preprotein translocase subunit SecG [Hydrocarboniphaga daqingensis]